LIWPCRSCLQILLQTPFGTCGAVGRLVAHLNFRPQGTVNTHETSLPGDDRFKSIGIHGYSNMHSDSQVIFRGWIEILDYTDRICWEIPLDFECLYLSVFIQLFTLSHLGLVIFGYQISAAGGSWKGDLVEWL